MSGEAAGVGTDVGRTVVTSTDLPGCDNGSGGTIGIEARGAAGVFEGTGGGASENELLLTSVDCADCVDIGNVADCDSEVSKGEDDGGTYSGAARRCVADTGDPACALGLITSCDRAEAGGALETDGCGVDEKKEVDLRVGGLNLLTGGGRADVTGMLGTSSVDATLRSDEAAFTGDDFGRTGDANFGEE